MTRIYIPLRHDEIERLMTIASAERRRPADQAAFMLAQALAQRSEQPKQQEAVIVR